MSFTRGGRSSFGLRSGNLGPNRRSSEESSHSLAFCSRLNTDPKTRGHPNPKRQLGLAIFVRSGAPRRRRSAYGLVRGRYVGYGLHGSDFSRKTGGSGLIISTNRSVAKRRESTAGIPAAVTLTTTLDQRRFWHLTWQMFRVAGLWWFSGSLQLMFSSRELQSLTTAPGNCIGLASTGYHLPARARHGAHFRREGTQKRGSLIAKAGGEICGQALSEIDPMAKEVRGHRT